MVIFLGFLTFLLLLGLGDSISESSRWYKTLGMAVLFVTTLGITVFVWALEKGYV